MNENDNHKLDEKVAHKPDQTTRARNRTVMLTPDITGQVRAKINQSSVAQTVTPTSFTSRNDDVAATISPQQNGSHTSGFYSQMVQPTVVAPAVEQEPPSIQPRSASSGGFADVPRREPAPVQVQEPVRQQEPVRVAAPAPAPQSVVRANGGINDLGIWASESPIVGFLVTYDNNPSGEICSLRTGRFVVTSAPQQNGSFLLIEDPSVSPLHAIMRVTPTGEIQVLDQLSESGTFIRRFGADDETELSGEKSFIEHGDMIRFGTRTFHVAMVVRNES